MRYEKFTVEVHEELEYKKVYGYEGFGGAANNIGIIILVAQKRQFNDVDKVNIDILGENLKNSLFSETVRTSKETKDTNLDNREKIIKLFAGKDIFVEEIENGYAPNHAYWKHFHWYKIATKFGYFKIGWRKRVLVIDWTETLIGDSAQELFPHENVTKDGRSIHADNYDKAREYMDVIMNAKFMESLTANYKDNMKKEKFMVAKIVPVKIPTGVYMVDSIDPITMIGISLGIDSREKAEEELDMFVAIQRKALVALTRRLQRPNYEKRLSDYKLLDIVGFTIISYFV